MTNGASSDEPTTRRREETPNRILSLQVMAGQVIPLSAVAIVMLAALHHWVYFFQFGDVFNLLRGTDFITEALSWLVPLVVAVVVAASYEENIRQRRRHDRDTVLDESKSNFKRYCERHATDIIRALFACLMLSLALLGSAFGLSTSFWLVMVSLAAWGFFLGPKLAELLQLRVRHGSLARGILLYGPIVSAIVVFHAIEQQNFDTKPLFAIHKIELHSKKLTHGVRILRNYAEGVLVYDSKTNCIALYPWHEIVSIRARAIFVKPPKSKAAKP